jgi:predicted PurR-regulated permease PerM
VLTLVVITIYSASLLFIAGILSGVLLFVPLVGPLIGFIIMGIASFAIGVTSYTMLAQTVKK